RKFLKGGMLAGAAAIVQPAAVVAQQSSAASEEVEVLTTDSCGSDYMVDVIKSLGFEYVCANPGSSFRGVHESIINYGGNRNPEFITNCHEESSVAMAHGYFKAEGKPMAVLAHGTVGLQNAAVAIYNAWCDRVPVYIMLGNYVDAAIRRPAEWYHGVQDCAGDAIAHRTRRDVAGVGHRPGRADEFPVASSAQSNPARGPGHRGRRCGRGSGGGRLLGNRQQFARPVAPLDAADHETRREAGYRHDRRSLHPVELPGFPAHGGRGPGHCRRWRGHAAGAHRSR